MKAFVLGAGLGVRMGELTEWLPKPLVPVWHRPLLTYVFDHLAREGIDSFVINTHHCAAAYEAAFPDQSYRGNKIRFVFEPELLDTGGALANAAGLFRESSFIVYNGDILCSAPLERLREAHETGRFQATLLLRSQGPSLQIGWDPESGLVRSIRGQGARGSQPLYQFTGIYLVEPAFLARLGDARPFSVVNVFLEMIGEGSALGACVEDSGFWADLGDIETYRRTQIEQQPFGMPESSRFPRVHSEAVLHPEARVDAVSVIGPGARVGAGASVRESVLWPGAEAASGERVERRVLRGPQVRNRFCGVDP